MIKLPILDCIKKLYNKHNITLTDADWARFYWKSPLPISEKLDALRAILDRTADDVLKIQIQEWIDRETKNQNLFMSCDIDCTHSVYLDNAPDEDSVFASINEAILYGKENCDVTFKIFKRFLRDKLESNTDKEIPLFGEAEFKKDGTLISCKCYYLFDFAIVR